jgi:peroxiredoxin
MCLVAADAATARRAAAAANPPAFVTPLGDPLPDVALQRLDGRRVMMRPLLEGRPALIYVFGVAECASCTNLALEFRIARREVPELRTVLVGSGAAAEAFGDLVKEMDVEGAGKGEVLIDEHRALIQALGLVKEPVVLLADASARILLADSRGASRAAQFPMGRILHGLRDVLRAGGSNAAR